MSDNLNIGQIDIIGGGDESLRFSFLDKNGEPLVISNSEVIWTMCNMGQKETPLLKKSSKINNEIIFDESCSCLVNINNQDTYDLYDNIYEHEIIIIQPNGKILRPCYGFIQIRKCSNIK